MDADLFASKKKPISAPARTKPLGDEGLRKESSTLESTLKPEAAGNSAHTLLPPYSLCIPPSFEVGVHSSNQRVSCLLLRPQMNPSREGGGQPLRPRPRRITTRSSPSPVSEPRSRPATTTSSMLPGGLLVALFLLNRCLRLDTGDDDGDEEGLGQKPDTTGTLVSVCLAFYVVVEQHPEVVSVAVRWSSCTNGPIGT